jgi:hypothetical protein
MLGLVCWTHLKALRRSRRASYLEIHRVLTLVSIAVELADMVDRISRPWLELVRSMPGCRYQNFHSPCLFSEQQDLVSKQGEWGVVNVGNGDRYKHLLAEGSLGKPDNALFILRGRGY